MEFTKFCPRCGRETDMLFGNEKKLCPDCYPDKNDILDIPREVEFTVCTVCGRMRKSGEWIEEYSLQDQLAAKFSEFAEDDVEMELQFWEDEGLKVRVHAEKGPIQDFYDTEVSIEDDQCPDCSRFQGGFYKVKLQLRGEEPLEPVSNEIVDIAAEATNDSRKDFLSNIDKVDHGFNFFLSTERITKKILTMLRDEYDPEIKRSYELIGEEGGEEVYRNVVSVRMD
ncbi:NMD3-related protein [Candidatus Nanosalina sp. VS9-1]|uniref:NMD3-related protein n=1 Tax=Candidatus Nanosalina sp. VS9-1 TaxID=3388566 RepID=UPI0039DF5B79